MDELAHSQTQGNKLQLTGTLLKPSSNSLLFCLNVHKVIAKQEKKGLPLLKSLALNNAVLAFHIPIPYFNSHTSLQ